MIKLFKVLISLLLIIFSTFGYQGYCQKNDIEFLVNKIKLDYPAYSDKTKHIDFDSLVRAVVRDNRTDTFRALSLIVNFFHDQHLPVYQIKKAIPIDTAQCYTNLDRFKNYLQTKKHFGKYEGYWINVYNDCIIAIKRLNKKGQIYQGIVIESRDSNLLFPGIQLMRLEHIGAGKFLTDLISHNTGGRLFVNSEFRSDSILVTGSNSKWRRIVYQDGWHLQKLTRYNYASIGRKLNETNYLITIPSSSVSNTVMIDSLAKAEYEQISHTENLIIDLRNNLGGTTAVYMPLLQFMYTKPIGRIRGYTYCTNDDADMNVQRLHDYVGKGNVDSAYVKEYLAAIQMERDSLGKLILDDADTIKYDSVMRFPKHVALIINYACQSAAEMLILESRQSDKVTLFGEHTMGAIDHLDYYPIDLPSKKYKLYMPTSKRFLPEGQKLLDNIGIYPDVFIRDSEKDWVEFVMRYYEGK